MIALSGEIKDLSLPWLFQDLRTSGKTATVVFEQDKITKKTYIASGEIIYAFSSLEEDQLGSWFVQNNKITQEQYASARELVEKSGKSIGSVLVERGHITPQDLVAGAKLQVKRIIFSLFSWKEGSYRVIPGPLPVAEIIPLQLETGNLLAESLRNLDWKIVRKSLPHLKSVLRTAPDTKPLLQGITLEKDQKDILDLIDGSRSIEELCALSGIGDFNALKAIHALIALRVAEAGAVKTAAEAKQSAARAAAAAPEEEIVVTKDMLHKAYDQLESQNFYEILNISRSATQPDIRRAYFRMAKMYHPDRHSDTELKDMKDLLEDLFRSINEAYTALNNQERRDRYDIELSRGLLHGQKESTGDKQDSKQNNAVMQFREGVNRFRAQNFWGAEEAFRWALRLDPNNADYNFHLGLALARLPRRGHEAEEFFSKAIELKPEKIEFQLELGNLYIRSGLKSKALAVLKKAQMQDPDSDKIKRAIQAANSSSAPEGSA